MSRDQSAGLVSRTVCHAPFGQIACTKYYRVSETSFLFVRFFRLCSYKFGPKETKREKIISFCCETFRKSFEMNVVSLLERERERKRERKENKNLISFCFSFLFFSTRKNKPEIGPTLFVLGEMQSQSESSFLCASRDERKKQQKEIKMKINKFNKLHICIVRRWQTLSRAKDVCRVCWLRYVLGMKARLLKIAVHTELSGWGGEQRRVGEALWEGLGHENHIRNRIAGPHMVSSTVSGLN